MISLLLLPGAPQFQCWRHKRHSTGGPWQEQHCWSQPWNWGHGAREWKAWWQQVQVEARDTLDHLFSLKCCLNNTVYRLKMRLMLRRHRFLRFMAASHFRASRRWALSFLLRQVTYKNYGVEKSELTKTMVCRNQSIQKVGCAASRAYKNYGLEKPPLIKTMLWRDQSLQNYGLEQSAGIAQSTTRAQP